MTWDPKPFEAAPFLGPDVTVYMTEDRTVDHDDTSSAFVECDAPDCRLTWDVVGYADLDAKDEFLRTQGWSAAPSTYAVPTVMRHLCPEHA